MQVTEAARKHSNTASQKAQDAKEYAQETAQAGSDYIKDTQQQGESAWEKVKGTVNKVTPPHNCRPSSLFLCSMCQT